jgi:hypothetical protein
LERVLAKAEQLGEVDIYLHGVCRGNFVIAADGVTLRGVTHDSGLAAPATTPGPSAVLEVVNAQASLRGLVVQGAEAGVFVHGWDAEVLLFEVDVHDQNGVGVLASRGARVRLLDTTVRDGFIGVVAEFDSNVNLQNVVVNNHDVGVVVVAESFAALNDTTIEDNHEAGLNVGDRSDANINGGVFRENGQVHVNANDWSRITMPYEVVIGSATDSTPYALGVNRGATIGSYSTPVIYGEVSALIGGSIRLGNTVLVGNLSVVQFSDAHVRNSEITGSVVCVDGADAICRQTKTGGVAGCPSPTCGSETAAAVGRAPSVSDFPAVEVPRFERPRRSRPRP